MTENKPLCDLFWSWVVPSCLKNKNQKSKKSHNKMWHNLMLSTPKTQKHLWVLSGPILAAAVEFYLNERENSLFCIHFSNSTSKRYFCLAWPYADLVHAVTTAVHSLGQLLYSVQKTLFLEAIHVIYKHSTVCILCMLTCWCSSY